MQKHRNRERVIELGMIIGMLIGSLFLLDFIIGRQMMSNISMPAVSPKPVASSVAIVPTPPPLAPPTSTPELIMPTDGSFIRTLEDWKKTVRLAYKIAEKHGQQIFPAYRLEQIPIILIDRENNQAVIMTPQGQTKAPEFLATLPVGFSIRANIPLPDGRQAYAFEIHGTAREDFLIFLVHEVCHMAQGRWQSPRVLVQTEVRPPEEILALMLLEEKLILRALGSWESKRQEVLTDFAAVRGVLLQPTSQLGQHTTENDATEWREGGPEYIAFRYARASGQLTERQLITKISKIFHEMISTEVDYQDRIHRRAYGMGAALGLLLDEETEWKKDFAKGRTFSQILLAVFRPEEGRFDAVAEREDFSALRAKAQKLIAAGEQRKQEFLARWNALPGPTITVEYLALKDEKKSASVLKSVKIADGEEVSEVSSTVSESPTLVLRAKNTFLRSTFHWPNQSVQWKGQPEILLLDGKTTIPEGTTTFKQGGQIKSSSIDLTFTRPGVCTVKGQTITIRLE